MDPALGPLWTRVAGPLSFREIPEDSRLPYLGMTWDFLPP